MFHSCCFFTSSPFALSPSLAGWNCFLLFHQVCSEIKKKKFSTTATLKQRANQRFDILSPFETMPRSNKLPPSVLNKSVCFVPRSGRTLGIGMFCFELKTFKTDCFEVRKLCITPALSGCEYGVTSSLYGNSSEQCEMNGRR